MNRRKERLDLAARRTAMAAPLAAFLAAAPSYGRAEQATCASLTNLSLADTTITTAQSYPAGPFSPATGIAPLNVPAFCRVAGDIRPTSDSDIKFEVWLPTEVWNGRYGQVGNGGFAGSFPYTSGMRAGLIRGFAIAGTDDGHEAGFFDGSWALGHPEKVKDYAYRAVHLTATVSQQIVAAFYGEEAHHSYFSGCSDGGREGLMEAQRFPDDFDGFIAGAPENRVSSLLGDDFAWNQQALTATAGSAVPPAKLTVLTNAVLAACDSVGGLQEGYLDNPRRCHFDPSTIQCSGADGPDCLTADQVAAVEKIYAGPRDPNTHELLSPGFEPGVEDDPSGWSRWITGPDGTGANSLERTSINNTGEYFVYGDPTWTFQQFDFGKDPQIFARKLDPIQAALKTDLQRVRTAGKKIIQYHGWGDPAIPSLYSVSYYRSVAERMGGDEGAHRWLSATQAADHESGGLPPIADFYRLFMVPGMGHCTGAGPGPNYFGAQFNTNALSFDPQHDMINAMIQWVENGVAPNKIIAVKYANNGVIDPGTVTRTRPLCPYPMVAKWNGEASSDDAANFTCVAPPHDNDEGHH